DAIAVVLAAERADAPGAVDALVVAVAVVVVSRSVVGAARVMLLLLLLPPLIVVVAVPVAARLRHGRRGQKQSDRACSRRLRCPLRDCRFHVVSFDTHRETVRPVAFFRDTDEMHARV